MASGLRVKKGRLIGCTKGATDIKLYAVMDASGRPIILVIGEHVFFAGVHELGELDAAQAVPASACAGTPSRSALASEMPISMPSTSQRPSALTPTATETMRPPRRTFR